MVIFYFLGVGPPCCSILCQFWLCEEAQCVYLRRHLGSPITSSLFKAVIQSWAPNILAVEEYFLFTGDSRLLRSPFGIWEFPGALVLQEVSRFWFRTQELLGFDLLPRLWS